ncbi:unnamed protein product [Amoebophrya sp. A25]|nr:unnamed protein product [Amoebophrya sp. A25]|eukprot:GSA25T00004919001.1
MTINPTLAEDQVTRELFPLPRPGEVFILKRVSRAAVEKPFVKQRDYSCFPLNDSSLSLKETKIDPPRGDFEAGIPAAHIRM